MPLRATVKTITQGAVGDTMHYCPRAIVDRVVDNTKGDRSTASLMVVLLPNQCKNNFILCQEALHLCLTSPSAYSCGSQKYRPVL